METKKEVDEDNPALPKPKKKELPKPLKKKEEEQDNSMGKYGAHDRFEALSDPYKG